MKEFFDTLLKCPLFDNIEYDNLGSMLSCLGAVIVSYEKNEIIISEGEAAKYIGIVLSGKVQLEKIDYNGNKSIITLIENPGIFGESFACAEAEKIPFNVIASEKTKIMLIDCKKITTTCCNACEFHSRMIFNLLKIVATKNIILNQKAEITSKRTTEEKLMTYLLLQAKKTGSNSFVIPYNRQELADFLGVDRSGLSAEIGKLSKKGILESKRNYFKLL